MDLGTLVVGIGSIVAGAKALYDGLNSPAQPKASLGQLPARLQNLRKLKSEIHDVKTIDQRIGYITRTVARSLRDPEIRKYAVQLVTQKCGNKWCVPEKDWLGEVKTVFGHVRQHVRYTRDITGIDTFQSAKRTFEFRGGDCDDYVIVLATLLMVIGFPVLLIVIRTVDSNEWNHIYLKVGVPPRNPTKWIPLDASVKRFVGWEVPSAMVAERKIYRLAA